MQTQERTVAGRDRLWCTLLVTQRWKHQEFFHQLETEMAERERRLRQQPGVRQRQWTLLLQTLFWESEASTGVWMDTGWFAHCRFVQVNLKVDLAVRDRAACRIDRDGVCRVYIRTLGRGKSGQMRNPLIACTSFLMSTVNSAESICLGFQSGLPVLEMLLTALSVREAQWSWSGGWGTNCWDSTFGATLNRSTSMRTVQIKQIVFFLVWCYYFQRSFISDEFNWKNPGLKRNEWTLHQIYFKLDWRCGHPIG